MADSDEQLSIFSTVLPNRWFFWALAAVGLLTLFPLYYVERPYPELNQWFLNNRWHNCQEEKNQPCEQSADVGEWSIHARTPKYGADFIAVPVELRLTHTITETQNAVISIHVCVEEEIDERCPETSPGDVRITLDGVEQNSAALSDVPPNAEVVKIFRVLLPSPENSSGRFRVRVRLNGDPQNAITLPLDFDRNEVFKLWITEHFLSPPGASILLPLIIILFAGFLEKVFEWGISLGLFGKKGGVSLRKISFGIVITVLLVLILSVFSDPWGLVIRYVDWLPEAFRDSLDARWIGGAMIISFVGGVGWGYLSRRDAGREEVIPPATGNDGRQPGNAEQHENGEEAGQDQQDEQATEVADVRQENKSTSRIAFLQRLRQLTSESLRSLLLRIRARQPQVDDPAEDKEETDRLAEYASADPDPESVQIAIRSMLNDTSLWLQSAPPPVSASVLDYLQRQHQTLPKFYEYYKLVNSPGEEHLIILQKSVEATNSSFLDNCTDARLLTALLNLYKINGDNVIKFENGIDLLGTFVALESAKEVLQQLLSQETQDGHYLVDPTLDALRRVTDQEREENPLTTEDLLSFVNAINNPDEEQFKQMVEMVCDSSREKAWPDLHKELENFLEKGGEMVDEALSGERSEPTEKWKERIVSMCLYVAKHNPGFAHWFIYKKLSVCEKLTPERFLAYFREIGPHLKKKQLSDGELKKLVEHDWWQDAMPDNVGHVDGQPDWINSVVDSILAERQARSTRDAVFKMQDGDVK